MSRSCRVSKGKMPSPQEISSGNCSPVGSSASLGARASRPHRVSEGKMPSLQETSSLRGQDALAPGDIISPRARCPRSRRHLLSKGKMPSLQETSSGNCSHLGSSTSLGARASRPHRVSEGKMPSLQEICEPRTPATGVPGVTVIATTPAAPQPWERGRPARIASPRARCHRSTRHANTYPRWYVSNRQYAIMRRLNECEARHRNGI